jgi:hypothetical protein
MPIKEHLKRLEEFARERRYSGYNPYDALNSPFLRAATFGTKWGRITLTQIVRRCPINLRPLLGIPPGENPKALGLFLEGYARLHRLAPRGEYAEAADYLLDRLDSLRTSSSSGHGWGYNFDWQSRAFFLPKFTPTIVCSSFVAHALLDTYEAFGRKDALELALPVADFILYDLNRTIEADTFCFSYSARDHYAVHNANLLGASVLIRLHRVTGTAIFREAALSALAYSMRHQHDDGSWCYSERCSWIDSFHTGFNLEAIRRFLLVGEARGYREAYTRGVRFYVDHFFMPDGLPKYYANSSYPADIHSAAEAICFLAGEGEPLSELVDLVLRWTLVNLADARGFFYFRKAPHLTNRIPYMRWSQAWMFRALTMYAAVAQPEHVGALSGAAK